VTFEPTIDTVQGFRVFEVFGAELHSYWADYVWEPGWNLAICQLARSPRHDAPTPGCKCGFWAYKTIARAMQQFTGDLGLRVGDSAFGDFGGITGMVLARVQIAGRVIEGTDGWRAERAGVVAVYLDVPGLLDPAAKRYGVSVEPLPQIDWPVRGLLVDLVGEQLRVLVLDGDRKFDIDVLRVEKGSTPYLEAMTSVGDEIEVTYERRGNERWVTQIGGQER
jgi:hypothetical protein